MTQQFPGSKRTAKILFAAFIATALTAFIWGYFVVQTVRARAKQTDGALRSIAWACLCYAQQGDHTWPDSEESLSAVAGDQWTCQSIAVAGAEWPATREAALAGMVLPATAVDAFKIAGLEFSKNPSDPPHVHARGNPSGLGTLDIVNGWLTNYQSIQIK
ncbi:MAG: hypothetical protein EXS17_08245 [Phycisphaerales bacterium]|nr:hypothetical protein [Phycisphaerales bacterium]